MKKLILWLLLLVSVFGYAQQSKYSAMAVTPVISQDMVLPDQNFVVTNQNDAPMAEPTNWALPQNGGTSQNNRAPSNFFKYQRTEYLITSAEMAASGFANGDIFNGIGFLVQQAGVGALSGTLNIYLRNTTDATYTLGSNWTTTGFTQIYNNASFSVPINNNAYYIVPFSSGFTYTGSAIYVAWEFSSTATVGTTPVTHYCNTALASGLRGANSATALPTALGTSGFRPATLFTTSTSLTDVSTITNIYTQEKVASPFGTPNPISVRVTNVSASAATFDVSVSASDGYTSTQTVTGLAAGTSTIVTFTGWTPVTAGNFSLVATTSTAAGETFTLNNTLAVSTNINTNLCSYLYSTTSPPSGYGFTSGNTGIFAAKYYMNGVGQVNGANLVIASSTTNTGNTLYAVCLNSAGTIVAQSNPYTILSTDLGLTKSFTFPTAAIFNNEYYYVGLAQPTNTVQWYPLGLFYDIPPRGNTFYNFALTGGTPSVLTASYRYGIEAQVGAYAGAVNPSAFTATAVSTSQINLAWTPNPTNDNVLVAWSADGVFGTPVNGTTYIAGQTITGGGTVLQYNTNASFNHTGLPAGTKYYYKIWSYNGSAYSLGVAANASTFCNLTAAPVTEDFELATFPPSCWSLGNTSTAWNRSTTASGYGVGSASAEANFYLISNTTPFDLITLPVDISTILSPVLRFDYAYAAYSHAEIDKLEIFYSTNSGVSYSSLQVMLGGPNGILNTAGDTVTTSFVPSSTQWATRTISLPAGTNRVKFQATSAYGNNLYIDNVKVMQYFTHDVATLTIDESQIQQTGSISPKATFKNYGAAAETFDVTLTAAGYSSTKTVTALAADATTQVTFDPWTKSLGSYTFTACTNLGTDQNSTNNCVTKDLYVLELAKTVYGYNAYPNTGTDPEGPTSFTLATPGTLNSIADQSALQFINGGTWANGQWYGCVYNTVAPYDFIKVDPVTGARTVIGDMGLSFNGLSFNPSTGIMYGVAYNSTTTQSSLYTINMLTGAPTLVGSTSSNTLLINLAIDAVGNCYSVNITTDYLGKINLATGAFTAIGPIGFNANYAQDMEFDRERGELYMAAQDLTSGWLSWVNKSTGTTIKIGDFEGGAEITGFAIPYTGSVVTFNVDMSTAAGFVPGTDEVYIAGSFPNATWNQPGTNSTLRLSRVGTTLNYTLTMFLPDGSYEYKYFKNAGWGNGEWAGGPNRSVTVAGTTSTNDTWGGSINWANLQWPGSGNISVGSGYDVYAQAYIPNGITGAAGQTYGLQAWIGYSTTDTDPSTWTNWIAAPFFGQSFDNDEFKADLGSAIAVPGTYYYASRFQFGNGTYLYGGFNGGFWNGTSNVSGVLTVTAGTKTLNVKLLLEGLAQDRGVGAPPAGSMFESYDESGIHWGAGIADKVTIELRNSSTGALEYSISDLTVSTLGNITASVPAAHSGSYYIYVKHRNSITTSSASPISFAGTSISYDFTTGAAQAFGSNQQTIGGYSYIFAGDENQDTLVDSTDLNDCDNDSAAFAAGYLVTDVNGDGLVDSSDMNIIDNNNAAFVATVLPF